MFLSDLSIRRPVFTVIVSFMLVLFGAIGYRGLGVDMMPKIEAPFITISVIYPGADPDVVFVQCEHRLHGNHTLQAANTAVT